MIGLSFLKHESKTVIFGVMFGLLSLTFIILILVNSIVPYVPVKVGEYNVTPSKVCAGDPVTATINRKFTENFDELYLRESWVMVDTPEHLGSSERTIATFTGVIPADATKPTNGYEVATSPLLTRAPDIPGLYRVDVTAHWEGSRFGWGIFPTQGTTSFRSVGLVKVNHCQKEGTK